MSEYRTNKVEELVKKAETLTPEQRQEVAEKLGGLEKVVKTETKLDQVVDGVKAVPAIIGCTAGAYLLGMSKCSQSLINNLPVDDMNLGYHLAAGSGLYGGWTKNTNRKATSLVTLAAAFTPEVMQLVQDGNLKNIGTASAVKLVGYGMGYVISYLFTK